MCIILINVTVTERKNIWRKKYIGNEKFAPRFIICIVDFMDIQQTKIKSNIPIFTNTANNCYECGLVRKVISSKFYNEGVKGEGGGAWDGGWWWFWVKWS